jgi:hypothetical protein
VRNESVTPLQALAMLNDAFVLRQSVHFADRLRALADDVRGQVRAACALAFGRSPTPEEADEWSAFAASYGLENFCRLILNSNEFLFVD